MATLRTVCSLFVLLGCAKAEPDTSDLEPAPTAVLDAQAPRRTLDAATPREAATMPDAGPAEVEVDLSGALYPRDRLLQVELTVAPADWELLRHEGRSVNEIYSGCFQREFDYTVVPASVTVDGQLVSHVGIRNRGLIGSISTLKPSLRIDLQEYESGQTLHGEKTLTLVNSRSDSSLVRTCLAYAQYRAAGVQAPRCAFAKVTVNGQAYGTYLNVEPVKKPFLRRRFGDDDGDLYESTTGDFRVDRLIGFEKKTHEQTPPGPELAGLAMALQTPDDQLLAALEPYVDIASFMRLWATDVLLGNDDSYSGNVNNYFVYVHPRTRKLSFMPWGPDGAFTPTPVDPERTRPKSVMAKGLLARRLYALASTREQYRQTLRELLDEHWDETSLLAEIERIAALVKDSDEGARKGVADFVRGRRAELLAELDAPALPWPYPEYSTVVCRPELNKPIRGRFEAVWGDVDAPGLGLNGVNVLSVDLGTGPLVQTLLPILSSAALRGPNIFSAWAWSWAIGLNAFQLDGSIVTLQLISSQPAPEVGKLPFHGFETFGELLQGPTDKLKTLGRVGNGAITFDKVPSKAGELVSGSFEGELVLLDHPF